MLIIESVYIFKVAIPFAMYWYINYAAEYAMTSRRIKLS